MKRAYLVPILGVLSLAIAAPACAQWTRPDSRYGYGSNSDVRRIAYERGFREGLVEGERDGRSRDAFRYQDERDFQRADIGYNRSYGDPERYRVNFRSGFMEGYAEGYRRYARPGSYGNYGNGRYDDRYGPAYGSGGYPQGGDRYLSPYEIGARDGYQKGREDARDRDRFDPRAQKWYREGDREYNSRYGNREQYKDEYRRGFLAGYERGYRGY
jgi:hypothetical protein